MAQMTLAHCDCCGSTVDLARFESCPVCLYPVQPAQEEAFLERSLSDLQRVARYGGASLRVLDLLRRYEGRLHFLQLSQRDPAVQPMLSSSSSEQARTESTDQSEPLASLLEAQPALAQSVVHEPVAISTNPKQEAVTPAPTMPVQPAGSLRGFSLSGDAMVNVLAAVGGFLILAGVLGTVFVTPNLWLAFLLVLGIHSAFGTASLLTRRLALLRAVSPLYTLIFALLVPLLAFSAYRLVEHNLVALSAPYVLALSSLYAAVIYALLAVVQRFVPFAYLGSAALLLGDLALAQALHLAYWWWPVLALLLPLVGLLALPRASGPDLLAEQRAILRTPLLILMYTVIIGVALSGPCLLGVSLFLDTLSSHQVVSLEPRVSLFVLCCLFMLWYALWLWCTRRFQRTPLMGYLCLMAFLLLGYVFKLDLKGYVLLETGVALLYHALVRATRKRFNAYGFPRNTLDGLALGLVALVLLQSAATLPLQLLLVTFAGRPAAGRGAIVVEALGSFHITSGVVAIVYLLALGVCLLITLDMALARAGLSKKPARTDWCWLLLLSGFLMTALYGLEILLWQVYPLWAFLVLSVALVSGMVLVRRVVSSAWAYPLELLALLVSAFTLILGLSQAVETLSGLLLGFAALFFLVALYQQRSWLALFPASLLLLALLSLQKHPIVLLSLSLALPLLAAGLSRAGLFRRAHVEQPALFTWSLLAPALAYGLWLAGAEAHYPSGVFVNWASAHLFPDSALTSWLSLHVVATYELAALGLIWYAAAVLARTRLCLVPATLFWLYALMQPGNNFWALGMLTPLLALLGMLIEKRSARIGWALPFYLSALWGAVIVCGFAIGQVMGVIWCLLCYALVAYILGTISGHRVMFVLTLVCSSLAVYLAASLAGNLYMPPAIAFSGALLGIGAGRVALRRQQAALHHAWPLYASALAAALLTGIYGMLGDLSQPFYGAIPAALFLYAVVTSIVAWIEQRPSWNWLVALFACWGVLLTQRLTVWSVLDAGVVLIVVALLSEVLTQRVLPSGTATQPTLPANAQTRPARKHSSWLWSWPWYSAFLVAVLVLGLRSAPTGQTLVVSGMAVFTLLAFLIMLIKRAPGLLFFSAGLAAWTTYLWQSAAGPVPLIIAYTLLCVLIYAAQYIWRFWPKRTLEVSEGSLYATLSFSGLVLVLIYAVAQGALSPTAGTLAQVGGLALTTLSGLLFFYGLCYPAQTRRELAGTLDEVVRDTRMRKARALYHRYLYVSGLLLSLAISWELLARGQTRFDALTLLPASYLIVIAPLLLRDQALAQRHQAGQWAALLGSALLFLPALWYSFQGADLLPTLILLGEALLLLLGGLGLRMRVFILSSAALIIVGTLRLLFISMPPSVPILLVVFGTFLMALATALILSRHRLQAAWNHWE